MEEGSPDILRGVDPTQLHDSEVHELSYEKPIYQKSWDQLLHDNTFSLDDAGALMFKCPEYGCNTEYVGTTSSMEDAYHRAWQHIISKPNHIRITPKGSMASYILWVMELFQGRRHDVPHNYGLPPLPALPTIPFEDAQSAQSTDSWPHETIQHEMATDRASASSSYGPYAPPRSVRPFFPYPNIPLAHADTTGASMAPSQSHEHDNTSQSQTQASTIIPLTLLQHQYLIQLHNAQQHIERTPQTEGIANFDKGHSLGYAQALRDWRHNDT